MSSKQQYQDLNELDQLCINTIRFLSADAIQQAKSGHPGLPMGMAGIAYRLFTQHLRFNPENPHWPNRDRFVLSAGHGSALLYSLLHLTGYDLSLEDLKAFRQLGSKTPGHPEYGHTPGVEATTGPLGQGISNAVGMAIAAKYSAACFNRPGFSVFDYSVYVLAGDGCLQEGVASEACSLAGHLGLENLIVIYDDNMITIDGKTDLSFSEDVAGRFRAYGWYVQEIPGDGHDLASVSEAIENALEETDRPSLIKLETVIGYGSPNKQGTSGVHGSPLGDEELQLAKDQLGWGFDRFEVPDEARAVFRQAAEMGKSAELEWQQMLQSFAGSHPDLAAVLDEAVAGRLPADWEKTMPVFETGSSVATRVASGKFLEAVMPNLPLVLGGSADLTPSNNTQFPDAVVFEKNRPDGRYIHFGVREHAMAAIINGLSLSGILRAYGATFLCFADYMLPAIRVAALSGYPSIFVFTHDSIGLGEDGPTHQPVEHLSYLRALPGLILFRPADAYETLAAWKYVLEKRDGPMALALTRQGLPVLDPAIAGSAEQVARGGYTLISEPAADVLLIATGSEVSLALEAHEQLRTENIRAQVVSMPSCELFERQPDDYRQQVVPDGIKARVVVEAGIRRGWEGYLGEQGRFVGMTGFGASAPAKDLFNQFRITSDEIVAAARSCLG